MSNKIKTYPIISNKKNKYNLFTKPIIKCKKPFEHSPNNLPLYCQKTIRKQMEQKKTGGISSKGKSSGDVISLNRENILFLQQMIGNTAVNKFIQTKLKINQIESKSSMDLMDIRMHTDNKAGHLYQQRNIRLQKKETKDAVSEKQNVRSLQTHLSISRGRKKPTVQRGILSTLKNLITKISPIDKLFELVVVSNKAVASRINIPKSWRNILIQYARDKKNYLLILALGRFPIFYRGGWILRVVSAAGAMTLDETVFVDGKLSLSTYIHELVHVFQYIMGRSKFLFTYFGMSALTILKRLLLRQKLNPMKSNPHENQAYAIEADFKSWYKAKYGRSADSVKV